MFVELERLRVDNCEKAKRIFELEAENRRLREALARVHQYLCALQTVSDDLGPHVSSKSVDEHEAIARAALSQEDRDGTGNEQ